MFADVQVCSLGKIGCTAISTGTVMILWLLHATFVQCIVNVLLQLHLLVDLDFLQVFVETINLRPLTRHGRGLTPSVVLQEM